VAGHLEPRSAPGAPAQGGKGAARAPGWSWLPPAHVCSAGVLPCGCSFPYMRSPGRACPLGGALILSDRCAAEIVPVHPVPSVCAAPSTYTSLQLPFLSRTGHLGAPLRGSQVPPPPRQLPSHSSICSAWNATSCITFTSSNLHSEVSPAELNGWGAVEEEAGPGYPSKGRSNKPLSLPLAWIGLE